MNPDLKNVLVTGGAGYVGTVLAPQLLAAGHSVTVFDTMWFGCELQSQPRLKLVQGDIRDAEKVEEALWGVDAVIHLACISNDPSFELDETLSTSINFDCFEPLVLAAKRQGVRRFIYASSSSVYGVSDAPDVREEHPLLPLTLYSKYKGMCEEVLKRHQAQDFVCVTVRPATVCGYSPRMRFDLTVNILTNHAVNARKITVFGGSQKRPNIHIQDICDVYKLLLDIEGAKIAGRTYNAGYQNYTVDEIAQMVKHVVEAEFAGKPVEIAKVSTNDLRSYHVNSDKIANELGFVPRHSIEDAVRDLCAAMKEGKLPESMTDERYSNVKVLKSRGVS